MVGVVSGLVAGDPDSVWIGKAMRVPGRKTYTEKCPDGTKETVHKDIKTAVPLYIPNVKGGAAVTVADLAGNNVKIDADLEKSVEAILFQVSERNESLMTSFWRVYATYQANPCRNSDFLRRKVDEMTSETDRLTALRLELKGLIDLATVNPGEPKQVWDLFAQIVTRHNLPGSPQASAWRIQESRGAARKWISGGDE